MRYRKARERGEWHYCRNCSRWPTADYEQRDSPPPGDEICTECRSMDDRRECQTDPPSGGVLPA